MWSHHGQLEGCDVSSSCRPNRKWNFKIFCIFKGGGAEACVPGFSVAEFILLIRVVRVDIVGHLLDAIYSDITKHGV